MQLRRIRSGLGVAILIGYVTFGLGLSGLNPYSILGVLFAFSGTALGLASTRRHEVIAGGYICLYLLILASWSWSPSTSPAGPNTYITAGLGGLLTYYSLARRWISWDALILVLCIPAILNALAFALSINLTESLYGLDGEVAMRRFSGFVGHPNPLITRSTLPLVAVVLRSLLGESSQKPWRSELLFLAALASSLFGIYSTGSKKGLIFLAICVTFMLVGGILYASLRSKIKLLVPALCCALVIAGFAGHPSVSELEVFVRLEAAMSGDDASTLERSSMVSSGWLLFQDSPLIGHGLDSFRIKAGYGTYSHNNAIEMLVNGGLILFCSYYFFLLFTTYLLWKLYRRVLPALFVLVLFMSYDLTGITASDRACQVAVGILMACVTLRLARSAPSPPLPSEEGSRQH